MNWRSLECVKDWFLFQIRSTVYHMASSMICFGESKREPQATWLWFILMSRSKDVKSKLGVCGFSQQAFNKEDCRSRW